MREFIVQTLKNAKENCDIDATYTGWEGNKIIVKGTVKDGIAEIKIQRYVDDKEHSYIGRGGVALTDDIINETADMAYESLYLGKELKCFATMGRRRR